MKARWLVVGTVVGSAACAQLAGLDERYTADAGSTDLRDAESDAGAPRPDSGDAAVKRTACAELKTNVSPCAYCAVQARTGPSCHAVCEEVSDTQLGLYFHCLGSAPKDPRNCASAVLLGDLADSQRDCVQACEAVCPKL